MLGGPVTLVRYTLAWFNSLFWSALGCVLIPLVGPSLAWIAVHRLWGHSTLWLLGIRLDIHGAHHLEQPAVIVSNHQSIIDVVALPAILPSRVRFIAKRELLLIPFWGWIFGIGGAVMINRKASRSAIESIRRGLQRLPPRWSLVVFPEGTRSRTGELLAFKSGAFHVAALTGLPMVALGIDGARDVAPLNRWLVRAGTVRINIAPPMSTAHWRPESMQEHVQEGRAAVQACMDQARRRKLPEAAEAPPKEALQGSALRGRAGGL